MTTNVNYLHTCFAEYRSVGNPSQPGGHLGQFGAKKSMRAWRRAAISHFRGSGHYAVLQPGRLGSGIATSCSSRHAGWTEFHRNLAPVRKDFALDGPCSAIFPKTPRLQTSSPSRPKLAPHVPLRSLAQSAGWRLLAKGGGNNDPEARKGGLPKMWPESAEEGASSHRAISEHFRNPRNHRFSGQVWSISSAAVEIRPNLTELSQHFSQMWPRSVSESGRHLATWAETAPTLVKAGPNFGQVRPSFGRCIFAEMRLARNRAAAWSSWDETGADLIESNSVQAWSRSAPFCWTSATFGRVWPKRCRSWPGVVECCPRLAGFRSARRERARLDDRSLDSPLNGPPGGEERDHIRDKRGPLRPIPLGDRLPDFEANAPAATSRLQQSFQRPDVPKATPGTTRRRGLPSTSRTAPGILWPPCTTRTAWPSSL